MSLQFNNPSDGVAGHSQIKEMKKQSREIVSFAEVVTMIRQAHCRAISFANSAMVDLYWRVGAQLSAYIANKHPDIKGFSDKNIWRMKQFYETYASADEKLSPLVREISWTNNMIIMVRAKSVEERLFYLNLCVHDHLSKRDLERQKRLGIYLGVSPSLPIG